jgi:hypothetical protein
MSDGPACVIPMRSTLFIAWILCVPVASSLCVGLTAIEIMCYALKSAA